MKTIWVLGDQLSPEHAALSQSKVGQSRVLMIESKARGSIFRYHKLKLVLVYSAMRHFAHDLREKGWEVDYYRLERGLTFEDALRRHQPTEISLAEPNSFLETEVILKLGRKLHFDVALVPTKQFLLPRHDFRDWAAGQKRLVMENHYRRMRKRFGWLMTERGNPIGGAWNFDLKNRATYNNWKASGAARATPPKEKLDRITREVMTMVAREFPDNLGDVNDFWLPVDRQGALRWLRSFVDERLANFGTFQDMMAEREPFGFHSVLSPLLNLGLLTPRECVQAAVDAYERGDAPINSVEGYLRQIIGWREFINGVYWLRGPGYRKLNSLGATQPLPQFFYTAETDMNCLHHVLKQNISLGWNHHIQRLMVIGNFCLIFGINPQEALRWYNEMYLDAYDWVMAPNVIGMSLYADGGFMATKPYAATSSYINRMSNYCRHCRYDPQEKTGRDACPFNYLYWDFVGQHAERFATNQRMRSIVNAWLKRSDADKDEVRESAAQFRSAFQATPHG